MEMLHVAQLTKILGDKATEHEHSTTPFPTALYDYFSHIVGPCWIMSF